MKKLFASLAIIVLLLSGCAETVTYTPDTTQTITAPETYDNYVETENQETYTVYITNTGECYHSYGCSYLRKSCHAININDAIDSGYRACSRCNP